MFHITATHRAEHCPLYNPELQASVIEAGKKVEESARELNLKLHFSVTGAPDHVFFHLVEADSLEAVRRWLSAVPIKQEFRITPVESTLAAVASLENS